MGPRDNMIMRTTMIFAVSALVLSCTAEFTANDIPEDSAIMSENAFQTEQQPDEFSQQAAKTDESAGAKFAEGALAQSKDSAQAGWGRRRRRYNYRRRRRYNYRRRRRYINYRRRRTLKNCNYTAGPICHGYSLRCWRSGNLNNCKAACRRDGRCKLAEYQARTRMCCTSAVSTKAGCRGQWSTAHGWLGYHIRCTQKTVNTFERSGKAKERSNKRERSNKARERLGKERRSKGERSAKERANKERTNKARERAAKERSQKARAISERRNKERAAK